MNLTFGDCVEIPHLSMKGFIIGEASISTDDNRIMVAMTNKEAVIVEAKLCDLVAAGYHDVARSLQTKYLQSNPDGLRWVKVIP